MISKLNHFIKISVSGAVILTMGVIASAQPFQYQDGDLIMTFRKNGAFQENYELVVDIGPATNYVTLAIGSTITVPNVSPTQVVSDSFNTYSNLSWAVIGGVGPQVVFPSYPGYTVWVTVPRARVGVKSKDAPRDYYSLQGATRNTIVSLLLNADYISSNLGFSNEVNNVYLVREPWADANFTSHMLTQFIGGIANKSIGTLQDTLIYNVEKTTPGTFNSGVVQSDLYEIRPLTDSAGNAVTDPHTTLTNGSAYYVGYFQMDSAGNLTFTRDVPTPKATIQRAGNVSTVSFPGYTYATTYQLVFTNSSGITAPLSTWPALPGTVTGDGTNVVSLQDTTADDNRFYRVRAQ